MFNRGILWLRGLYRSTVRRIRFLVGGPPATYSVLYKGAGGEVRRDHLLNIVSQSERSGMIVFRDVDGHASYYAAEVVLRIRRRVGFEEKRQTWPQTEGVSL